ncbi:MAG: PAS domain S-box protein [Candidatus Krumholzibacteriota bacterium]|nr:PAS domain S-box protein [Candidatus Krumholzibacteriota bacterium]
MKAFPRAFSPVDEGKLRRVSVLRLVVATVVVGAAIMALQIDRRPLSLVALYSLLGVFYLSTGGVYLAFRAGISFSTALWLHTAIDLAVLTAIMHCSGGSASNFTILYVLPILASGTWFRVFGGTMTAVLASSAYIIYTALELGGWIALPADGFSARNVAIQHPLVRGYLHMAVFVFTGLASGWYSRRISRKSEQLADRDREIRRIQLSTDNIVANMSSGLIVTDTCGEIVTINPAALRILGLDANAEYGGQAIEEVAGRMKPLVDALSFGLATGEPRRRQEIEVERVGGGVMPLGLSISSLLDENGESRGVIALFQDLTEVRRMRERIRWGDKMAAVGELSAAIAHEVRAPLASICGSIQMLAEELDTSGENRDLMDLIIRESERLDNIISDFLEYARLKHPDFSSVDIERYLDEVLTLLRHSSPDNRAIDMKLECRTCGMRIMADDELIRQVFLNIGLNACDAVGRKGRISIGLRAAVHPLGEEKTPTECVRIDMANDGPPIPADVLPRVFEPFFTTKGAGTGLGLAISARIVESHGGAIEVRSDETGTVFSVFLPIGGAPAEEDMETIHEIFETMQGV